MNLIKFPFKYTSFFFLILSLYTSAYANAVSFFIPFSSPIIQELVLPRQLSDRKIHDILFDSCENLYLSTKDNLWISSGNTWQNIRIPGLPEIAVTSSGEVYVGSGNRIFMLAFENNRYLLKEWLNEVYLPEKIRDLIVFNDQIFVVSEKEISLIVDGNFRSIAPVSGKTKFFTTLNAIILQDKNQIRKISKSLEIASVMEESPGIDILLDHPSGFIIVNNQKNRAMHYSGSFDSLSSFSDLRTQVVSMIHVDEGRYALLYKDNTIAVLNEDGSLETEIRDDVLAGFERGRLIVSPSHHILAVFNNSIFGIDYPSRIERIHDPLRDFVLKNYRGKEVEKETLCLNTISLPAKKEEGYFLSHKNDSIRVEKSPGDSLVATFLYADIFDKDRTGILFPIFYTLSDSFLVARNIFSGEKQSIPLPATLINNDDLCLLCEGDHLWLYNQDSFLEFSFSDMEFIERKPCMMSFVKIAHLVAAGENHLVGKILSTSHPGMFFIYNKAEKNFEFFNLTGFPAWYANFFILDLDEESFLLSYQDQVIKVEKSFQSKPVNYKAQIKYIVAGKDTILEEVCYENEEPGLWKKLNKIPYSNNNLILGLETTSHFDHVFGFQYKFQQEENWSNWKEGNRITLLGLSPGNHRISVRVMSETGEISEACELSFRISKPLYFRGFAIFLYVLIVLVSAFVIYRWIILYKNRVYTGENELIETSDALKEDVSQEVKKYVFHEGGHTSGDKRNSRWDKYEMVTVLFSDIQGFTKIAEQMNPEKLIDELDQFFFHFDSVVEKYNIEKIKTIGDAYMAAGGIPVKNRSNPVEVVLAAIEMQQFMKQMQKTRVDFWDLRIGIHTGPVIAGIVGHKKRSYDIWGDTVNTASRMESSGEAGRVNISGETYQYVKDYFICEYRGKLPVKYKGNLDMYFVRGLRPELSINLESLPNRKFYLKLQLLRLSDLEEYIFDKLQEELPKTLFFHTADYAKHLYHYAGLLSKAENLDMEENLLILTASLLLPVGYMDNYMNPEAESSSFAIKILPVYHYNERQIQNISNLILASKYPPEPRNLLEKIMVDIRLEYLGRADFIKMYKLLFLERNEYLENMEIRIWKEQQIRFLENFNYFTAGAKRLSEITFDKQIQRIQEDEWN